MKKIKDNLLCLLLLFTGFVSSAQVGPSGMSIEKGGPVISGYDGNIEVLPDPINGSPGQKLLIDNYDIQTSTEDSTLRCGILYIQDSGGDTYFATGSDSGSVYMGNNLHVADTFAQGNAIQHMASGQIAYGTIRGSDTSIVHGSGNFTVAWNGTFERFEIEIDDINYHLYQYTTTASAVGSSPYIVSTSSLSGKLLVYMHDTNGDRIRSNFAFVVNKFTPYNLFAPGNCNIDIGGPVFKSPKPNNQSIGRHRRYQQVTREQIKK